jgi:hypothetical protein
LIVAGDAEIPRDPNGLHSGTTGTGTDDQRVRAKIVAGCGSWRALFSRGVGGGICSARIT